MPPTQVRMSLGEHPQTHSNERDQGIMEPLLFTPEQAAGSMGTGRTTIYALMASGELESIKIGRSRRIPREAVEAYVERLRGEARALASRVAVE